MQNSKSQASTTANSSTNVEAALGQAQLAQNPMLAAGFINKKFKILTYAGNYVDIGRLHLGIYNTIVPKLLYPEVTIESLTKEYQKFDMNYDTKKIIENLNKCVMVEVELCQVN